MPYNIKPSFTIHSATIELTGAQLVALANAKMPLQEVCTDYQDDPRERPLNCIALDPVAELLEQIAALLDGFQAAAAPTPAKRGRKPNPTAAQPA